MFCDLQVKQKEYNPLVLLSLADMEDAQLRTDPADRRQSAVLAEAKATVRHVAMATCMSDAGAKLHP